MQSIWPASLVPITSIDTVLFITIAIHGVLFTVHSVMFVAALLVLLFAVHFVMFVAALLILHLADHSVVFVAAIHILLAVHAVVFVAALPLLFVLLAASQNIQTIFHCNPICGFGM